MSALTLNTTVLSNFSRRLINCPRLKLPYKKDAKDAAVLMPLCTVDGQASVLFTVRNKNMRSHQGEISFPGGKADPEDPSLEYTALREMSEEVGIPPSAIDILGSYSTLPNKNSSLRVHPFIGYIRQDPLDLSKYNPDEVSSVFTLPIEYLIRPEVREVRQFRESNHTYTVFKTPKTIEGEDEIWGLTGFILDGVLRRILPDHYK